VKIGELAERGGVDVQTVRYYERRELLPEPRRAGSGYREYDDHDLHRLRFNPLPGRSALPAPWWGARGGPPALKDGGPSTSP
jgi:hypothetical protein